MVVRLHHKSPRAIELCLLLLLATLWSASYSFIKLGVATIPPVSFIAARTILAGGLLLAILRIRGVTIPKTPAIWSKFAFQALMNSVIPFTLIAYAETHINASLGVILNSTSPIFTFLIAWLILGQDSGKPLRVVGVLCGMIGIVLVVGFDALRGIGDDIVAEFCVIIATICYAISALFSRNFKGLDPMLPACGSMLCGAVMLTPIALIIDQPWQLHPSLTSVLALIALAVFSTALAFVIFFRLIGTLGAVATTSQAYLRVPIGVLIGMTFLGDSLAPTAYFGMGFVMVGVAIMTLVKG